MIMHPDIDPVAISLGPLQIHWYSLMYLMAFACAWVIAMRASQRAWSPVKKTQVEDLIVYGAWGVLLGGRLGYMFFYSFDKWVADPSMLFRLWEGGMSFHGGLLGVILAIYIYARKHRLPFLAVGDFVAPLVPTGLFFGRLGNFIGQELYGRATEGPWAMLFPSDPLQVGRHPSQLYEALLEGLVLFMTIPGLSLFYAGLVRSKNVLSVLMQCFAITCLASIIWLAFGYSIAFGDGGSFNAYFGNLDNILMGNITEGSMAGDIPESVFAMFQMTFAVITPALIVGAFAERMRFSAMLVFSGLWLVAVYAPITHWVWGGGWLGEMGLLDFAGGTVVHITAGVGALVAALVIGNRKGFPTQAMPPHNLTMTVTGAGMLWVGWFGFNGGSALAANGDAGMAILVTHISAATGSLAWMMMEWIRHGKPSVLGIVTGMVAGLGTITPASGFVGPGGALVIGFSAGIVCYYATQAIKQKFKIDDSLDVFPVHGVGGILGTILAGVFASDALGVFSGQGFNEGMTMSSQVQVQIVGVVATFAYTAIITYLLLKLVDKLLVLRVDEEQELQGVDLVEHDEKGYDL
ncbi:prolipoprotein diacylglyceryl transferase [Porticoccaceae bacterium]|nr:prolipoprotein diacylglyceryl transferase [Porticoccaceae bacterium]